MQNDDSGVLSPQPIPMRLIAYGLATALVLLAVTLRWLFLPILGPSTPFILLAIIVSAWYGGLGPGLFATALSALISIGFPYLVWNNTAYSGTIPFASSLIVLGVIISLLEESLHRARRRIIRNARQINESNKRFHLLVNSINDYGIFMLDVDGKIISWNAGAEKITGYSASEIIGQYFGRFYTADDLTANKPERELQLAEEVGHYEEEGWRLRSDGSRFWASVLITAIRDDNGELCGFSKVTRDMTERREAEERAVQLQVEQAARVEAEAANRAKDQFLSIVSHELRTPLNAILGWANLLREGKLDAATTEQALETIERSSRVQSRLVEDLLDVSRIMSGKMSIETEAINLFTVRDAALSQVRRNIEAKQLELRLQPETDRDEHGSEPRPILIAGDAVRLEQVLTNLLSNAIKFTPAGGCITLAIREAGDEAEIIVADTGDGIKPEVLPHIFERFRQADSSQTRSYGGLGLGLAVARYVVEAHGGTITACSDGERQGSTFIVRIPLLPSWAGRRADVAQPAAPEVLPSTPAAS